MPLSAVELEAIIQEGQCVYALCWDTGEPFGGAGCERVYSLNGAYVVVLDDGEEYGPYSTLREAIAATEQLYMIGPATTEIESTQLTTEDILAVLKPFDGLDEPALTIRINDAVRTIQTA
jgi:hypothetical protein